MPKTRLSFGFRLNRSASIPSISPPADPNRLTREEVEAIGRADRIYYPNPIYEDVLRALGKPTYPGNYYHFMGNKIVQTQLFTLLEVPHPRTRIYYKKDRGRILGDFTPPFVAKIPVGSSRGEGVFLIQREEELDGYLKETPVAYIQEYLPIDRDLRVVLLNFRPVHAYWRIAAQGEFRNNVSRGGKISFERVPEKGLEFASWAAERCGFQEVGLDVCLHRGSFFVIEANMFYGHKGFEMAGLHIRSILGDAADRGLI